MKITIKVNKYRVVESDRLFYPQRYNWFRWLPLYRDEGEPISFMSHKQACREIELLISSKIKVEDRPKAIIHKYPLDTQT